MYAVGDVVKSKSGRDKDRFLVVVAKQNDVLYLCDGKMRKLSAPKKKKEKHVTATTKSLDISQLKTDKQLRIVLSEFNT